ncbi:kappa-casein [Ochotona curzoniae]|uniref:kappa-casein n=1 Tax=Ochotona curzoniae TaxID=130825 RepID=UPI001B347D16|nr:kappa-casein [Ochotona curzoniae]
MMKHFLLVLNVLALTLPFLAAEIVQSQEQPTCRENEEKVVNQKTVPYVPVYFVMSRFLPYRSNFYQHRPAVPTFSPFMLNPYYIKPIVVKPNMQIPQWQTLPNVHQPTEAHHPRRHPLVMAIRPNQVQEENIIPTLNTVAAEEPTPIPSIEPFVNTEVVTKASPEFISSPEPATVAVAPSTAEEQ